MSWTERQWSAFCALLDSAWPGDLTSDQADAYRLLLDGHDPEAIVLALQRLLHRGSRFRPSVSELLGELRKDPSQPTFEEALRLIFGSRGALRTLGDRAAIDRGFSLHPLIGAFLERQGPTYLRTLPIHDPDYGQLRRKELREAWDRHLEAFEDREVATLAARTGPAGLHQLDPLTALGVERPRELTPSPLGES